MLTDEEDALTITLNGEPIANGSSAEWETGENELVFIVTSSNVEHQTAYTVTVTKS